MSLSKAARLKFCCLFFATLVVGCERLNSEYIGSVFAISSQKWIAIDSGVVDGGFDFVVVQVGSYPEPRLCECIYNGKTKNIASCFITALGTKINVVHARTLYLVSTKIVKSFDINKVAPDTDMLSKMDYEKLLLFVERLSGDEAKKALISMGR